MGRRSRRVDEEEDDVTSDDESGPSRDGYALMTDQTPFSCCCIVYRYLLDTCLVLALSPFVVNCFVEAGIYLINFDWGDITWGKAILGILVLALWISIGVFGTLCCIAIVRKGVFTRRLRKKQRQAKLAAAEYERNISEDGIMQQRSKGDIV